MKRLALLLSLLACCLSASAQFSVGAGYRGSYKTYNYRNVWYNGFYFGGDYLYGLGSHSGVSAGLYYSRQTHVSNSVTDSSLDKEERIVDNYLALPLNYVFGQDLGSNYRVSLFAGPELCLDVLSYTKTRLQSLHGQGLTSVDNFASDANYRRFDIMLGGGVAFDFYCFRLSAGYNYGILDRDASDEGRLHRHGMFVGLAYKF